jgi:hypothetical protein
MCDVPCATCHVRGSKPLAGLGNYIGKASVGSGPRHVMTVDWLSSANEKHGGLLFFRSVTVQEYQNMSSRSTLLCSLHLSL